MLGLEMHFHVALRFSITRALKRFKVSIIKVWFVATVLGEWGNCGDLVEIFGVEELANVTTANYEKFSLIGRLDCNSSAIRDLPVDGVTDRVS